MDVAQFWNILSVFWENEELEYGWATFGLIWTLFKSPGLTYM